MIKCILRVSSQYLCLIKYNTLPYLPVNYSFGMYEL